MVENIEINKERELLRVLKRVDKYFFGNFNESDITLSENHFVYSDFSEEIKNLYTLTDNTKKKYLHYFLNKGIQETGLDIFKFFSENLKIYYGFFSFIDPYSLNESDTNPPIYLWGNRHSPTFQIRWILKRESNGKIISPNEDFFHFYISLNDFLRNKTTFSSQDYVRIFNIEAYADKRNDKEKEKDFLYIPSSEIDHCILQYLVLYLKNTNQNLDSQVSFDFLRLGCISELDVFVKDFEKDSNKGKHIFSSYFYLDEGEYLLKDVNLKSKATLSEWMYSFGYFFKDDSPTPRLRAAMEYFFFLLQDLANKNAKKTYHPPYKYLELIDETTDENHQYKIADFESSVFYKEYDKLLSSQNNTYWVGKAEGYWKKIFKSYLDLLFSWQEPDGNSDMLKCWQQRCRFGVFSHFVQRCFLHTFMNAKVDSTTSDNMEYWEHHCKGILILPIIHNTKAYEEKDMKHWGYFMCIVNDSDSLGRCYFNWYNEPDGSENNECVDFYKNTFYRIKVFAKHLGNVETSYIFFDKIINGHIEGIKQEERLRTLTNISNASHSIKTMVQRVLRPKATYLLNQLKDDALKSYQEKYIVEIDQLVQLGELINISSKLLSNLKSKNIENVRNELLTDLEKIGIINKTTSKNIVFHLNLSQHLNEFISLQNQDIDFQKSISGSANLTKVNEVKCDISLDSSFIVYTDFYLTNFFFNIFCATALENHIIHGISKDDFDNDIEVSTNELSISITTNEAKSEKIVNPLFDKGVFGALNLIFKNGLNAFEISHEITNEKKHILQLKKL